MNTQIRSKIDRLKSFWLQDPQNKLIIKDLLDSYVQVGDVSAGWEFFQSITPQFKADTDIIWQFGQSLTYQGYFSEAASLFQTLPDTPNYLREYGLGLCFFMQRQFSQAKEVLESAFVDRTNVPPLELTELYARTLLFLKDLENAFDVLSHVKQHSPDSLGLLSLIALDMERYDDADKMSDEVLKYNENQQDALISKITCLYRNLDFVPALSLAQHATGRYPLNGRLWSLLGQGLMLNQQIPEALNALQKATEVMPDHIGTWHLKAWCELMLDDLVAAETSFSRALELNRNFAESHGGLAVVLANRGEMEQAQHEIKVAMRLDPNCLTAKFANSMLLRSQGEIEKADHMVNDLLNTQSHLPEITYIQLLQSFSKK
ncbi:hypothetical protein KIH87_12885 [Paraneptunicella aestuarii]|uniref:tetratricopeptide repeat protein n=1 Tax=Paraneptunicella aestuarii TaxID=2831148 RepID=UPI001E6409C4|nr:hypothetical protein [Paraneptunicella aestuarii]UAA37605.1 hypothetical protein KIH87_12885 [Paraneptunicella aestuarii]